MAKHGYVYVLWDPRTGDAKYVGASEEPRKRLGTHIAGNTSDEVEGWIGDLWEVGELPEMTIEHRVGAEELGEKEREVIIDYFQEYDLLNSGHSPAYPSDAEESGRGFHISREKLNELRWERGLSRKEVAEECGVSKNTVERLLKKYSLRWDMKWKAD